MAATALALAALALCAAPADAACEKRHRISHGDAGCLEASWTHSGTPCDADIPGTEPVSGSRKGRREDRPRGGRGSDVAPPRRRVATWFDHPPNQGHLVLQRPQRHLQPVGRVLRFRVRRAVQPSQSRRLELPRRIRVPQTVKVDAATSRPPATARGAQGRCARARACHGTNSPVSTIATDASRWGPARLCARPGTGSRLRTHERARLGTRHWHSW